jgi:acyl-CoA hydrolase
LALEPKTVSASEVVMTQLVLPSHTNALDTIFGGVVMSWIDICAAICAQRHSQKVVVTASMDHMDFVAPIKKGWVVNLKGRVNFVSRTSMEIGVRVDAEDPRTGETFHTSTAYLTFVAIGSNGKPAEVPQLKLISDDDKRRFSDGQARRAHRLTQKKKKP